MPRKVLSSEGTNRSQLYTWPLGSDLSCYIMVTLAEVLSAVYRAVRKYLKYFATRISGVNNMEWSATRPATSSAFCPCNHSGVACESLLIWLARSLRLPPVTQHSTRRLPLSRVTLLPLHVVYALRASQNSIRSLMRPSDRIYFFGQQHCSGLLLTE